MATKRDLANLNVHTQASFVETHAKMDVGFAAAAAADADAMFERVGSRRDVAWDQTFTVFLREFCMAVS